jgi:hypothetical protein
MIRRPLLHLLAVIPACTTAQDDGTTIHIDTRGGSAPAFVAYRDAGAWKTPKPTAIGFDLQVHPYTFPTYVGTNEVDQTSDAYLFVAVCANAAGFDSESYLATAAEGDAAVACHDPGTVAEQAPAPASVLVQGRMVQSGRVSVAGLQLDSSTPGWAFEAGTAGQPAIDVIAVGDDHWVTVLRDVPTTATVTLPPIDVDVSGTALEPAPVRPDLASGESLSTVYELDTANGGRFVDTTDAGFLPARLRAAGDRQSLTVRVTSPGVERGAVSTSVGANEPQTAFDLLDALPFAGVGFKSFDETQAVLDSPPARYDTLALVARGVRGTHQVRATRRWFEVAEPPGCAGNGIELDVDTSAPGYDPRWLAHTDDVEVYASYHDPATAIDYVSSQRHTY